MSTNAPGNAIIFLQFKRGLQDYTKIFLADEFSLVLIISIYADLINNDKDIIVIKDSSR